MKFEQFNLDSRLKNALAKANYIEPTPVQKATIPLILEQFDLIAQAKTGTGKTAAFALPILQMIFEGKVKQALVLLPTRELAKQVDDEFKKFYKIKSALIYGGKRYDKQLQAIKNAKVIVATPGRLKDLLSNYKVKINPDIVVLDEADEMLDMGFLQDIKQILALFPKDAQTLLFSATMPKAIVKLAKEILEDPKRVSLSTTKDITNEKITQSFYLSKESTKKETLINLLQVKSSKKAIIFVERKIDAQNLADSLQRAGLKAKSLHGNLSQRERERVMQQFKSDTFSYLVATDIAARGLDVKNLDLVINFALPQNLQRYVHRIGRCARGGNEGEAISIVSKQEHKKLMQYQKILNCSIKKEKTPSKKDIAQKKENEFLQKFLDTTPTKEAKKLFDKLNNILTSDEIALKLLTLCKK